MVDIKILMEFFTLQGTYNYHNDNLEFSLFLYCPKQDVITLQCREKCSNQNVWHSLLPITSSKISRESFFRHQVFRRMKGNVTAFCSRVSVVACERVMRQQTWGDQSIDEKWPDESRSRSVTSPTNIIQITTFVQNKLSSSTSSVVTSFFL